MKNSTKLKTAAKFLLFMLLAFTSPKAFVIEAVKIETPITIDGFAKESIWKQLPWYNIDQPIIGKLPDQSDFSGRYKIAWNQHNIFMLVEIVDDVLFDAHPNPLQSYWDDDCLEIFIDEDYSGGDHQFNFNAFAYHLALDNQVVDLGPNENNAFPVVLLNDHVNNRWQLHPTDKNTIVWELAITVYDDSYQLKKDNTPVKLFANKKLGFMVAYCDNDGGLHRESFVGSKPIEAVNGDKNRGYIDASVFDQLILKNN